MNYPTANQKPRPAPGSLARDSTTQGLRRARDRTRRLTLAMREAICRYEEAGEVCAQWTMRCTVRLYAESTTNAS
jgi:hypothetical protein